MQMLIESPEILDVPSDDDPPRIMCRETVRLADLKAPSREDGRELIANRFLCRGGSVLFVGPTGSGKSSFAMQAAVLWSIGKPCFDLRPSAPLRVLYIQAENDSGDLYEIRNGIYKGLELAAQDMKTAGENVRIGTINDAVSFNFLNSVLPPLSPAEGASSRPSDSRSPLGISWRRCDASRHRIKLYPFRPSTNNSRSELWAAVGSSSAQAKKRYWSSEGRRGCLLRCG